MSKIISFNEQNAFVINPISVVFWAKADGERIKCWISAEALEDDFQAQGGEAGYMRAFADNRAQIEAIAREKIEAGETPSILSGDAPARRR